MLREYTRLYQRSIPYLNTTQCNSTVLEELSVIIDENESNKLQNYEVSLFLH